MKGSTVKSQKYSIECKVASSQTFNLHEINPHHLEKLLKGLKTLIKLTLDYLELPWFYVGSDVELSEEEEEEQGMCSDVPRELPREVAVVVEGDLKPVDHYSNELKVGRDVLKFYNRQCRDK